MPKLYRYTLAFDGQPQNIGLFQGLSDVGLDDTVINRINAEFSTLKAPDLDEPAEFYFTEAGRKKYDFPLCFTELMLNQKNWQLIEQVVDFIPSAEGVLYQDEYQIAFKVSTSAKLMAANQMPKEPSTPDNIPRHRVCITRNGYAMVPGNTPEEIKKAAMALSEDDFAWEPVDRDMIEDALTIMDD